MIRWCLLGVIVVAGCATSRAPRQSAILDETILTPAPILRGAPRFCPQDYAARVTDLRDWYLPRKESIFEIAGGECSHAIRTLIDDAAAGCKSLDRGSLEFNALADTAEQVDRCLEQYVGATRTSGVPRGSAPAGPGTCGGGFGCAYRSAVTPWPKPQQGAAAYMTLQNQWFVTPLAPVTFTTAAAEGTKERAPASSLESALINGLADLVISRSKEEAINYVVEQLGVKICASNDGGWVVRDLFPNVCGLVASSPEGKLGLRDVGAALIFALRKDLNGLVPAVLNASAASVSARLPCGSEPILRALEALRLGDDPLTAFVLGAESMSCRGGIRSEVEKVGAVVRALLSSTKLARDLSAVVADCRAAGAFSPEDAAYVEDVTSVVKRATGLDLAPERACSLLEDVTDLVTTLRADASSADRGLQMPSRASITATMKLMTSAAAALELESLSEALHDVNEFWRRIEYWTAVARASYAVAQGVRRGENPVALVTMMGTIVPCYEVDDPGCALRFLSFTTLAITQGNWREARIGDDPSMRAMLGDVYARLQRLVERDAGTALQEWCLKHRCRDVQSTIVNVLATLQAAASAVEQAARVQTHDPTARRAMAARLLTSTVAILRAGLTQSMRDEHRRAALRLIDLVNDAALALDQEDYGKLVVTLVALGNELGTGDVLPPTVRRQLALVSELASAREAKQVSAVLEKHAAPVGSWRSKRTSDVVSLTAYFGGTFGQERTPEKALTVGLFAPVGVEFTSRRARATGLYLSLLDLGAITAARFDDDGVDTPNVGFAQLLSPGVFVRTAIAGPFTVGAGVSMVPALRSVADGEKERERAAVRAHVFLAVDVTLARIYVGQ